MHAVIVRDGPHDGAFQWVRHQHPSGQRGKQHSSAQPSVSPQPHHHLAHGMTVRHADPRSIPPAPQQAPDRVRYVLVTSGDVDSSWSDVDRP